MNKERKRHERNNFFGYPPKQQSVSVSMLLLLMFVSIGLMAQSKDVALTDAELAWLEKHPVVRVSNEMAWTPFNFNRGSSHKSVHNIWRVD